jgi:hypothetical protein
VEAIRRFYLVVPAGLSLHGWTLVARPVDSAGRRGCSWITLSGWIKSMAAESASHGYADAATGSAYPCRTDRDPSSRTHPPRGLVARELPTMRRSDPHAGSEMDGSASGGLSVLRIESANEEWGKVLKLLLEFLLEPLYSIFKCGFAVIMED